MESVAPQKMEIESDIPMDLNTAIIRQYYDVFFPYKPFVDWLTYFEKIEILHIGDQDIPKRESFAKRELSFTLQNDVYNRFLSYNNEIELKKVMVERTPVKIDIGAIYTYPPSSREFVEDKTKFEPVEKEIVFDIDLTDYDEVRTCCKGTTVCKKCWKFLVCAAKILDTILRNDLKYQNLLWVFSGRRGIHCWVCDSRVRKLKQQVRLEIVTYISEKFEKSDVLSVIGTKDFSYPSIKNSYKIIAKYFNLVLEEQNFLSDPKHIERMVYFIKDESKKTQAKAYLMSNDSAANRWNQFCSIAGENAVTRLMYTYMYPRLDINVSKGFNHLLKSPFCIHPSTGNICTPLTMRLLDQFDPSNAPTVYKLLNSFDAKMKECKTEEEKEYVRAHPWEKTDGSEYYRVFEQFLSQLKADSSLKKPSKPQ
jgi:DNA primase small subunit